MILDPIINTALRAVMPFWLDTADVEEQSSTAGSGSDTPGWNAITSAWPCVQERQKEGPGAREAVDGGAAQAFVYKFTGPAVHDGSTLIGVVKKGMRLRVAAKDALSKPEQIFIIEDVGADVGAILTIAARLPD